MITLIWKELRENVKWALLAMIVLGGAELYALFHTSNGQPEYYSYNDGITLCKRVFFIATTFGCAAVGFLLGLIQILPELKQDRWAALLHRPVPRGAIFLGKAVAGVLLYLLATAPPFLLCVWLAATPGHFVAPFVPGLALAGTADTCAGLLYYFAALGVALQGGGKFGLKAFPLFATMHVTSYVVNTKDFGDAICAGGVMAVALCVSAWGAMRNQNSVSARPWIGKFALLVVAFYGICGVGDLARLILSAGTSQDYSYTNYVLSDAGAPLKVHYVNNVVASVQDLDGNAPRDPNLKPDRVRTHIRYLNTCSLYIGDSHGWHRPRDQRSYRESNTYLWASRPLTYPRPEQWYYLPGQRIVVGMRIDQKAPIGRLDDRGFEPMSTAPAPFPPGVQFQTIGAGGEGYCMWDAKTVRFADLAKEKIVHPALPFPSAIYGVTTAWSYGEKGLVDTTAIALASAVAIYDQKDNRLIATLPYDRDMDRWGYLDVGVNGSKDRFFLWYKPSIWMPQNVKLGMPSYLEEMDAQGKVLHAYTIPTLQHPPRSRGWTDYLIENLQSPAFFFGSMIYQKAGSLRGNSRLRSVLARRLGEDWKLTREIAASIVILSFLLAGITLWWARRVHFSWSRACGWAGLVLAFNVAGFIAFRLGADWPRLVPCFSCGRNRPVEEEQCPHCGKVWPELKPNGAEIFDRWSGRAKESAAAV